MKVNSRTIQLAAVVLYSLLVSSSGNCTSDRFDDVLTKFEKDLKKDGVSPEKKSSTPDKTSVQIVGQSPDELELKTLSENLLSIERNADAVASELSGLSMDLEKEQKKTGLVSIVLDQSSVPQGTVINQFVAKLNGRRIFSFDPIMDSYDPDGMKFLEAPLSVGRYSLELEFSLQVGSSRESKIQTSKSTLEIVVSQPSELIEYRLTLREKANGVEANLRRL